MSDLGSEQSAPQNGTGDLDALLSEYSATISRSDGGAVNGSNGNDSVVSPADDGSGLTLDDIADPRYWEAREQAAYAHHATQEAQQYLQQAAKARDDADTEALLKEVRGDHDPAVFPDKAVRAFLIQELIEDPSLYEVFQQRMSNPRAYEGLRRQLTREFHRMAAARPDGALTEDRDMVAAAVRGASVNKAPQERPASYGKMSNIEYRRHVQEQYGYDPG